MSRESGRRRLLSAEQRALLDQRIRGRSSVPSPPQIQASPSPRAIAPMSLAQEQQWLFHQLTPGTRVFNLYQAMRIRGPFEPDHLRQALAQVVRRHDVLRTRFGIVESVPVQVVEAARPDGGDIVDIVDLGGDGDAPALAAWARAEGERPFCLERGPLFRVKVARLGRDDHLVFLSAHHIICDAWSLAVLVREVSACYAALATGRPADLPHLRLQYADYAVWQRHRLAETDMRAQLEFWADRLADAPVPGRMPWDRHRPSEPSFRAARYHIDVDPPLVAALARIGRERSVTMFMLLLTGFVALLHRYSGATDIVVGSSVSGRTRPELEPLIGLFINTVAFRLNCSGEPTPVELLARVRDEALQVYRHQDVPFETIVERLGIGRAKSHSPLFQTMLIMQPVLDAGTFDATPDDSIAGTIEGSTFDLILNAAELETGAIHLTVDYATDLFGAATIGRMMQHWLRILEAIATESRRPLSVLPLLDDAERRRAVGPDPAEAVRVEVCVHELVSRQSSCRPNALALVSADRRMSYAALEATTNRLGRILQAHGVGPEVRVGLAMERSCWSIVGLLAIFKAGGVCVPLDPNYPATFVDRIIEQVRPVIVLTTSEYAIRFCDRQIETMALDTAWPAISQTSPTPVTSTTRPDNLSVILHSSGSTGLPNAIMVTHRALAHRLTNERAPHGAPEVYAHKTSLNFIDALWEIFMPLIHGDTAAVLPEAATRDRRQLLDELAALQVTRIVLVPSLLRTIVEDPASVASLPLRLRSVACSGESLPRELVISVQAALPGVTLCNIYGASEFWDATSCALEADGVPVEIAIGQPDFGMRVLLLDPNSLEPLPDGVAGEIFVGGDALARGYFGSSSLTAERFLPDPFHRGQRLYRTGDLAYRGDDGTLFLLGRRDLEIKLRGYRIHPAEIERALRQAPGVRDAVAVAYVHASGERGIAAYLVVEEDALDQIALRRELRTRLPAHMVPTRFMTLGALPLMPNGKVDRRSLPSLDSDTPSAPATHASPSESTLHAFWCEMLPGQSIGLDDNFFDLGGHSLMLLRLQDQIARRFGRPVSVTDLFRYPTIRHLASHLDGTAPPSAAVDRPRSRSVD